MTRRGARNSKISNRSSDIENDHDEEDDDLSAYSRRKIQKINYAAIENNYDDLDEELGIKSENEDNNNGLLKNDTDNGRLKDDDDDDFELTNRRSTRSRNGHFHNDEDDDDEYISNSDDTIKRERRKINDFISKDDDEDDEDDEYDEYGTKKRTRSRGRGRSSSRKTSKRGRGRPPKNSRVVDDDEDDEDDEYNESPKRRRRQSEDERNSILNELQELEDSSSPPFLEDDSPPPNRALRQRKNVVNYTIPPPLPENLDDNSLMAPPIAPSTPRRRAPTGPLRRLFPTGGPFGGGDVTSIFGKNYSSTLNSLTGLANNQLAGGVDSDSSDDEILAMDETSKKPAALSVHNDPLLNSNKKNKKQIADSDPLGVDMNIDFNSVGGLDNYINQLKEMVALPLLYPEVYQNFHITPPRGVLFHGPPGTGKTLMARALAASCSTQGKKITFFMRKGADCLSKWVGEAERQLRLLFEEAKKQQPSIIFFDEIDGLAPVRSSKQEQIHASIVSTLLALMDGMDNRGQVIVIGATNRPDAVDPALRRPGRFDREFYFPLPDLKSRQEILKIHTKKWVPPLSDVFIKKLADLTKGYGGADLRALCTEAALNSIQRAYPQIYNSNDKLKIDVSEIQVSARDFMRAIEKIVPSSARSLSNSSAPLPEHLEPLLSNELALITQKLSKLIPNVKKMTSLEEAMFIDPTENDEDGGFAKHELLRRLESTRICRPRLLLTGKPGNGQQYLGSAILNYLEGFNVQHLDLSSIFNDSTRSIETAIIQSFIEARRHQPSIIFIPNIDIWYLTLPESAKSTFESLLRSLKSNERIMLLGLSECELNEIDGGLRHLFGLLNDNYYELKTPNSAERLNFFQSIKVSVNMKPIEFLDSRPKRKLKVLEKVEIKEKKQSKQDLKDFEKSDMRLKNTLKIKLAGLMDLFKVRYKKFKKPPIEDALLIHLFDAPNPLVNIDYGYVKDGDMILEVATQKKFYNMDLDIVEERLWNGFYSEPKQFLRDIELIYLDSVTMNDRERLIKASEMFANAQVGIDEISTPELIEQCKGLKLREAQRRRIFEEAVKKQEELNIAAAAEQIEANKVNGDAAVGGALQTESAQVEGGDVPMKPVEELNGEVSNTTAGDCSIKDETKEVTEEGITNGSEPAKALEVAPINEETVENKTDQDKVDEDQQIANIEVDQVMAESGEQQKEEEDEQEDEQVPLPDFIINNDTVDDLINRLVESTEGCTVEELEQINSKMMEIIWSDRKLWDRNGTLESISKEIEMIKKDYVY